MNSDHEARHEYICGLMDKMFPDQETNMGLYMAISIISRLPQSDIDKLKKLFDTIRKDIPK